VARIHQGLLKSMHLVGQFPLRNMLQGNFIVLGPVQDENFSARNPGGDRDTPKNSLV
jgi:hypothetical protein